MSDTAEQLFLSAVIRSGDVPAALRSGVSAKMFTLYSKEWLWVERHYVRHHRSPEKAAFRRAFPDFLIKSVDDVEPLIDPLREEYAQSALLSLMDDVANQMTGEYDAVALLKKTEIELRSIGIVASSESSVNVLDDWRSTFEEVSGRSERTSKQGLPGISTGFRTLDRATGGIQPGHFWIGGARLGQGKTWWLVKIATAAALSGANVHIESLEQPRGQITTRLHTFLSGGVFQHSSLSKGTVNLDEYRDWLCAIRETCPGTIQVTDATRGRTSVSTIASHVERHRPDIVVVDYLTLLKSNGDDWKAMASVSSDLKTLAMSYGVGIVAAAQLNREFGLRSLPGPEALAQSDAFGQDADAVITMRRHKETDQVMEMRLSKYRHGEDGMTFYGRFMPNTGDFTEIGEDEVERLINL
ncbi:DnaB Replicative DNA helicase [uncultured Caudovirales phage]|uniref:DnaB Replicative DNA helicase n=1 Tax=uncultured Caudovirales phage TaxID=2100421 RepID=A0A6J5QAP5_9CAUD|nr:DnaB Replicative DNA helicase [uncultured Caudovirales phage]